MIFEFSVRGGHAPGPGLYQAVVRDDKITEAQNDASSSSSSSFGDTVAPRMFSGVTRFDNPTGRDQRSSRAAAPRVLPAPPACRDRISKKPRSSSSATLH